jgi:hypothetical protein
MASLDTWIYALPAEWDALGTPEAPFSYVYSNAITGYWNDFGAYTVYNVVGEEAAIQDILDALSDVAEVYAWGQGTGFDSEAVWPTDPTNILAVMKDHITYDEFGVPTGSTPATEENPNWGHVFFGQSERIFAGTFSAAFSGAFL